MRCGLPFNTKFSKDDVISWEGRTYLILEVLNEQDQYKLRCLTDSLKYVGYYNIEYVDTSAVKV